MHMATENQKKTQSIALVSAPWPLYNRPSIQLGALKGYLENQFSSLRIEAYHLYLSIAADIGYDIYQAISERTWLAEAVYAALLYPERFQKIESFFRRKTPSRSRLHEIDLKDLSRQVARQTDQWSDSVEWNDFAIVGFSVSLCQFSSTLYLLRQIKQRNPEIVCLVGGSSFSGISPAKAFEAIDDIDVIISGEGELPLRHLIQSHLINNLSILSIKPIKGLFLRDNTADRTANEFSQISSLDQLPLPQYDDYFRTLTSLPPENHFFPTLPYELSRGCWWQRSRSGRISGCAFCNLNLQWRSYRQKSTRHATAEIDELTSRYKSLTIAFTDNLLPIRPSDNFYKSLSGLNKDFRLFGEIRANTEPKILRDMQLAGMREVQIGIEALSSSLLRKLGKGTRAIENLAAMKNCEELGLKNVSNVILQFPGSDSRDVEETLYALQFALCFRPLKPVEFWLGLGSPIWQQPEKAGIRAIFNHRNWFNLFPKHFAREFPFTVLGYRGDRVRQRRLWQPVKKVLKTWEEEWRKLHQGPDSAAILSYRDGRDFIVIRQRRLSAPALTHRLTKVSAQIYRMCRQPQSFRQICVAFSDLSPNKIQSFLKMMVKKRLMFGEGDDYLSLAVSEKQRLHCCS